jgi:hypothetical protein
MTKSSKKKIAMPARDVPKEKLAIRDLILRILGQNGPITLGQMMAQIQIEAVRENQVPPHSRAVWQECRRLVRRQELVRDKLYRYTFIDRQAGIRNMRSAALKMATELRERASDIERAAETIAAFGARGTRFVYDSGEVWCMTEGQYAQFIAAGVRGPVDPSEYGELVASVDFNTTRADRSDFAAEHAKQQRE